MRTQPTPKRTEIVIQRKRAVARPADLGALWGTPADLAGHVAAYLEQCDVSDGSRRTYAHALLQTSRHLTANGLHAPGPQDLLDWKRSMDGKLSPYTSGLYIITAKAFFKWAHAVGLWPNVAEGLKAPRKPKGRAKDAFADDQLRDMIAAIDTDTLRGKRDKAILLTMLVCGLRCIEVVRADAGHVTQATGTPVLLVHGKGRASTDEKQVLPAVVRDALDGYLTARGKVADTAPLFASCSDRNRGQRLTTRSISRMVKTRGRAVGIDSRRLTAHSLRHTAVSTGARLGCSVYDLKAFARHANIDTTLGYVEESNRLSDNAPEYQIAEHFAGIDVI